MTTDHTATVPCIGCGGQVPDVDGPTHPYMLGSPGCWQRYGAWCSTWAWSDEVGAAARAHHVDCYAVQHPGGAEEDRRQRQSVAVHLVSLCLLLEHGLPPEGAARLRGRTSDTLLPAMGWDDWPTLTPPADLGDVTVVELLDASEAGRGAETFTRWADTCWAAWGEHHHTVRSWARVLADRA